MIVIYAFALFLSAFLMFSLQPLIAKSLLAVMGGSPAVWTICMLFFQGLLLFSYTYAWILSQIPRHQIWRSVHLLLCLVSLFFIPWLFQPSLALLNPEWGILRLLTMTFFSSVMILGATAPLLQFALSRLKTRSVREPYYLYSVSNLGSFTALLAYPFVIERMIGVSAQYRLWSVAYLILMLMIAVILLFGRFNDTPSTKTKLILGNIVTKPDRYQALRWIFLAFVPNSLLLGITFFLSSDIAPTPLLWTLPLALYLLSFVMTFVPRPLISHAWLGRMLPVFMALPVLGFILKSQHISILLCLHLSYLWIACLWCHGELMRLRPEARYLTFFYLCLALAGVLAAVFNGLIVPNLFNAAYEYPLAVLLSAFTLPHLKHKQSILLPLLILILVFLSYPWSYQGLVLLRSYHVFLFLALLLTVMVSMHYLSRLLSLSLILIAIFAPFFNEQPILAQWRNFYGIKHIEQWGHAHVLLSQNTVHGFQMNWPPRREDGAYAYYAGMVSVIDSLRLQHQTLHTAIVGLGSGMLACQFAKGDSLTFFEIDTQVIALARDSRWFSFLKDCPVKHSVIVQDGRLGVAALANQSLNLLILDAFSSDAIPSHLFTLEAIQTYFAKLKHDGVLVVHISNRYLNLLPVLNAAAWSEALMVLHTQGNTLPKKGQLASEWVILTRNEAFAQTLMSKAQWQFVGDGSRMLWTDDYSNLIPLFR